MFFVVSKLFEYLAPPSHWLGLLVLATALCLMLRRVHAAAICAGLAVLVLILAGTPLVNGPLIRALEKMPRSCANAGHHRAMKAPIA
jgi:hypothetical protein